MVEYKPFKYTLEIKEVGTCCMYCKTSIPKGIYKYYRCSKCHKVIIDARNQPVLYEEVKNDRL